MDAYPDIDKWFIGGHSQGGAVSTLYTRDRKDLDKQAGLIYLGCYVLDRHSLSDRFGANTQYLGNKGWSCGQL